MLPTSALASSNLRIGTFGRCTLASITSLSLASTFELPERGKVSAKCSKAVLEG